jgi:hypothetical protein
MSLDSTIRHLSRRYVGRGVDLALGRGRMCKCGSRTRTPAIVFYVRRKRPGAKLGRERLPAWVYDRRPDGSVDRSLRHVTDVQAVGSPAATHSGEKLRRPPVRFGSATLAFDVRRPGQQRRCYVVSGSHVIGNVFGGSFPMDPVVETLLASGTRARGRTVAHVWARQRLLRFDVALARLTAGTAALPLRTVPRAGQELARLANAPREGKRLRVVGAKTRAIGSGRVRGKLDSPMPIEFRRGSQKRTLRVSNLYDLEGFAPRDGDSGGLLYAGSDTVGIVVARHAGGCFFQPLRRALAHLFERSPEDVLLTDIF